MLALALGVAYGADTIVVHATNADTAVYRVASDVQKPVWEMAPVRFSERLKGADPRALGANQPEPCGGVRTSADDVKSRLAKVESRVTYEQWEQAVADHGEARNAIACLLDPVDPAVAARVWFLAGITATALGDHEGAKDAYLQAFAFAPELAWDETFTPDWRSAFESAQAEDQRRDSASVLLGPGMEDVQRVLLDGKEVAVGGGRIVVPEGAHVVQILEPKTHTIPVRAASGREVALAIPAKIDDGLAERAEDAAVRPLLDAIVDHLFGEVSVCFWTGTRTVRGGAGWEVLPSKYDPGAASRASLGGKLVVGGAIAAGTGLAVTAYGLSQFLPNQDPVPGEVGAAYVDRLEAASRGAGLATGGIATLAVGAVALGVGVPLALSGGGAADLLVSPVPGGAMVAVHVRGGAR